MTIFWKKFLRIDVFKNPGFLFLVIQTIFEQILAFIKTEHTCHSVHTLKKIHHRHIRQTFQKKNPQTDFSSVGNFSPTYASDNVWTLRTMDENFCPVSLQCGHFFNRMYRERWCMKARTKKRCFGGMGHQRRRNRKLLNWVIDNIYFCPIQGGAFKREIPVESLYFKIQ